MRGFVLISIMLMYAYKSAAQAQLPSSIPPYTDIVIDYGRPLPVWQNGALSETFLFNAGFDIYSYKGNSTISIVIGGRIGSMKNDGIFTRELSQQVWGTKLQGAFIAGVKMYRPVGNRVVEGSIVAGPVHMANIEIGNLNEPMSGIITEAAAYAELFSGTYIGAKFIYYPALFTHKLQPIGGSSISALGISLRVAI